MTKSSSENLRERLLDDNIDYEDNERRPSRWRLPKTALELVIVSLLVYIAAVLTFQVASTHTADRRCPGVVGDTHFTLPNEVLRYEERHEWERLRHPWNLEPSDELDAVWNELLYALNVRVTSSELDMVGEDKTNRVQVNGSDYAGVLGVFHHLHCLNNLRRVVHWDYYGPRLANAKHPEGYSKEHSDHCIDTLRQALMCHANTAIYTAEWTDDPHSPVNKELRSDAVTTCVNWDALNGWARQRALVPGHYHYLSGPYKANRVKDESMP
ncbi:hypothetical protein MFIFM68171_09538 [Madurella fahalii]|uniref:Uncharacterized protein n=1 Tax=Madurella fahalii TaxID=1157608 RepID=A0ABQ0GNI7_9PEZI